MAGNIKGLTVEIGGDTTKLGKALEDVNKKSRNLSSELGEINRMLKLDPGNTELLAQKQKVLAEAISNTKSKLETLKEAEKQAQEQFARGDISEEQYRALQREVIATERKLQGYESALEETTDAMDGLDESTEDTEKKSGKFGEALKTAAKAGLAAITAAAAAALALGKQVVGAYADYEQLVGGVETLFKDSAGTVQEYANNAYKTAGMSANAYMETVTGFSASLIQSLGGDTEKAAKYADMAITDMSDNANKMGSDIGSIQNAYQGFAKQNYTMLDNLKLGYGGTKEEMERLLKDAQKLSGVKYDISSYSDIVDAIHVVQTEMGITGTTALEAEKTISGSISTLKGALQNLVTGLGNADADVSALAKNVVDAFKNVLKNITPVINNLIGALPDVLTAILAAIADMLPGLLDTVSDLIAKVLELIVATVPSIASAAADAVIKIASALVAQIPSMISAILQIVGDIMDAISAALPGIINVIVQMIPELITTLLSFSPDMLDSAITLLSAIVDAIPVVITALVAALPDIIQTIVDVTLASIPVLLDAAIDLLMAIVDAIPTILTAITENLPQIIETLVAGLTDAVPLLLAGAIKLLMAIVEAIPTIVKSLADNVPQILKAIIDGLKSIPSQLWEKCLQPAITKVVTWGSDMISKAKTAAKNTLTAVVDGMKELPSKIKSIGSDLVTGLWNGINDKLKWLKQKIASFTSSVLSSIKSFFGVHSPSTETAWIGEMLDEGLAEGVEDAANRPIKAMRRVSSSVLGAAAGDLNGLTLDRQLQSTFGASVSASGDNGLLSKLDKILDAIESGKILTIDGDTLVGATAGMYDRALGQRRTLAARGAI